MSIVTFIVITALVGLLLFLVNKFIPMKDPWPTVLNVGAAIIYLWWVLQSFGILDRLGVVRAG